MPFRFGVITMRASPSFTLAVTVEDRAGRRATGYAADFLAFRWFDKRPEKSLADNCDDLIRTVEVARELYLEAGRDAPRTPFRLFLDSYPEIERQALAEGFNRLGASFGSSMLERAVIDARRPPRRPQPASSWCATTTSASSSARSRPSSPGASSQNSCPSGRSRGCTSATPWACSTRSARPTSPSR